MERVAEDGRRWKRTYLKDVQFIFSRVQHHVHKKTKSGYVPLKACKPKCAKKDGTYKADFPKTRHIISKRVVICGGLAKHYGLLISGRRNAFGSILGRRSCEWQSGTTHAFAVLFRSNTHTMPNYRLPVTGDCHEDELCRSERCKKVRLGPRETKIVSKLAQRVLRETTGYYCGYTFKRQPVGKKTLRMGCREP